jgi:hypothetical protein
VTVRILFLGEGTSDSGITIHIQRIASERGVAVVVTDPLLDRLPSPPRRTVMAKLQAVKDFGGVYDLVVVHRDADREGRAPRLDEIQNAVDQVMPGVAHAPVIPIRMTEAWLLLDERELRQVAANPNARMPLSLPAPKKVETIPDPKAMLKETLARASGLSGRKLAKFHGRFPQHRRQLLERIDPVGPITEVPSWCAFTSDLEIGLELAQK